MAFEFRWFLLGALVGLSGCAGGGGAVVPPGAPPLAPSAELRTAESTSSGLLFAAFPDRVDVYRKDATGSPAPLRTITGMGSVRSVATDRFGNVYVGDGAAWTVREYGPLASGNAKPLHVYTASTPPGPHEITALGVRWDGGIAVLASDTAAGTSAFAMFEASDHSFEVKKQLAGEGLALAVDGSGDVLVGHTDLNFDSQEAAIERFSPHPYGFHDDGTLVTPVFSGFGLAVAASPSNVLQVNSGRYDGSGDTALTPAGSLGFYDKGDSLAFDARGRLYESNVVPANYPRSIDVFAANGTLSRIIFIQRENGLGPIGLAVSG